MVPTDGQVQTVRERIAADLAVPVADVDVVPDSQHLSAVYTVTPTSATVPAQCTEALEIAFHATLCAELKIPCHYILVECVKAGGPQAMVKVPFFPTANTATQKLVAGGSSDSSAAAAKAAGGGGEAGAAAGRALMGAATRGGAGGSGGSSSGRRMLHGPSVGESSSSGGGGNATTEASAAAAAESTASVGSMNALLHQLAQDSTALGQQLLQRLAEQGRGAGEGAQQQQQHHPQRQQERRSAQAAVAGTPFYMAVAILMNNDTNNAQFVLDLFQTSVNLFNYQVTNPAPNNVTQSAGLNITVRNPPGSDRSTLFVLDSQLTNDIATGLNLAANEVVISRPGVVVRSPSAPKRCPSPRLGVLCGADAVGAIIGIILGGLVLLGLLLMALLYSRRGRMSKVVVMDDFAWARKYAHIVPTNVVASPYVTQYGVQCDPGSGAVYR